MIDQLRPIAIFSTVVDQGSFRAAALHLGLAPSRVSQTVSDLEKRLNVTLLYRSTRHLSLTQEGRLLHARAQEMLKNMEAGLDELNQSARDPHGMLRVTAPAFVTQTELMDRFADFAATYPRVSLTLDFSDTQRDLIKQGFDVSIRAGWLDNSEMMTRNIGEVQRFLVASPDYVARKGMPDHPSALEDWDWIAFAMRSNQTDLTSETGQVVSVTGKAQVTVNSASALYEFATRGLGVTAIPETMACRGFDRGDLVHILPAWSLTPLGLHAVWPDQSRRETLTLLLVRFLADAKP
ncbi:MAG: LysR family transcriptional regulator [Pseudomonadota bacterium]